MFFLLSTSINGQPINSKVPNTILTGKIENYDPTESLAIYVNYVGKNNPQSVIDIDAEGNFKLKFHTAVPLDVTVAYKVNFLLVLHPQDSLCVQFDGAKNSRVEQLRSISFGGDNSDTNLAIAGFQELYYSNIFYTNFPRKQFAVREYDHNKYSLFLDSLTQESQLLYLDFSRLHQPNQISKEWVQFFLDTDISSLVGFYMMDHRNMNSIGYMDTLIVPSSFWDRLKNRLPLKENNMKSSSSINRLNAAMGIYASECLRNKWLKTEDMEEGWGVSPSGIFTAETSKFDSLKIHSILNYIEDPMMQKILIAQLINNSLEKQNLNTYDKYAYLLDVGNGQISDLSSNTTSYYNQVKYNLENPTFRTEAIVKKLSNNNSHLLSQISEENKGKIIYIDLWATWCGSCLEELPHSRELEKQYDEKVVTFIYVSVNCEETQAKAKMIELGMNGQHYFLNKKQSKEILTTLEVVGIPHYIIMDQKGTILHSGSHMRPNLAKIEIDRLLQ